MIQLQLELEGAESFYRGVQRLLVCGSRTMRMSKHWKLVVGELELVEPAVTIIHGGQGRKERRGLQMLEVYGADMCVDHAAWEMRRTLVEVYPAVWDRLGKAAGPIRNTLMLEQGRPDAVLAFWDGESAGTMDTVKKARVKGLPVRVVGFEP